MLACFRVLGGGDVDQYKPAAMWELNSLPHA